MQAGLPPAVWSTIELALEEDLGRGDITTSLAVPANAQGRGKVIAREELVLSGGDVLAAVCHAVDESIAVEMLVADGQPARAGQVLAEVSGPLAGILMAERTALNFLQRLCGVATLARAFVDRLPAGSSTKIVDTRKTTPGLRFLERRAVRHGGAGNHRTDLGGGILIKENHVAAAGSLAAAVTRCREGAPHSLRVEVEVRDQQELAAALEADADAVLLDNMKVDEVRRAVEIVAGRAIVEASGGVALETVAEIAATGVDVISVGALTHSAPSADLTFLVERE